MITLDVLLWAFLASYVIHIVDETTMNGGFIRWIQASFWPTYTSRMNFWFNGGAVCAIAISNLLYDLFGGHWVILALIWPFGFALHGLTVHLFWTGSDQRDVLDHGLLIRQIRLRGWADRPFRFLDGRTCWCGYRWDLPNLHPDRRHTDAPQSKPAGDGVEAY